jgi:hypothetical protein
MLSTQTAIEPVIGAEQVKDGGDKRLAFLRFDLPHRDAAVEHIGMIGALEMVMFAIAEIGEGNVESHHRGRHRG